MLTTANGEVRCSGLATEHGGGDSTKKEQWVPNSPLPWSASPVDFNPSLLALRAHVFSCRFRIKDRSVMLPQKGAMNMRARKPYLGLIS